MDIASPVSGRLGLFFLGVLGFGPGLGSGVGVGVRVVAYQLVTSAGTVSSAALNVAGATANGV